MKLLAYLEIASAVIALSFAMKPAQLKFKISKLQCAPVDGYEPEPCYNFGTKKLVPPEECGPDVKKNAHCCIYNCTCIVKGAGDPRGIIPEVYILPKLSTLATKKRATTARLLENCEPDPPTTTTPEPTAISRRTTPARRNRQRNPPTKKPQKAKPPTRKAPTRKPTTRSPRTRKPATRQPRTRKTTTKSPRTRKPATRKPRATKPPTTRPRTRKPKPLTRKPTTRSPRTKKTTRKPRTTKPPTRHRTKKPASKKPPTRKPPAKKPCTATKSSNNFGLNFFSSFSSLLSGFGFNAGVVGPDDCD